MLLLFRLCLPCLPCLPPLPPLFPIAFFATENYRHRRLLVSPAATHALFSFSGEAQRKVPMKELFGVPKLKKDGTPGSLVELPPIDEIQTRPDMRNDFIWYSAYDAQVKTQCCRCTTFFHFFMASECLLWYLA